MPDKITACWAKAVGKQVKLDEEAKITFLNELSLDQWSHKFDEGIDIDDLLDIAAYTGQLEVVRVLTQAGVKPDGIDGALVAAASQGHLSVAKFLLGAKANIEATAYAFFHDLVDQTALRAAATTGHDSMVKFLISANANIEAVSEEVRTNGYLMMDGGYTALMMAAMNQHLTVVKSLLSAKAKLEVQNDDGQTALVYAAMFDRDDSTNLLINAKADIEARGPDRLTALMRVAGGEFRRGTDTLRLLLDAKAQIDATCDRGWTALMHAAAVEHGWAGDDIVEALIDAGADPEMKGNQERTPLHMAAVHGSYSITELLLANGVKVDPQDDEGDTPLMLAALAGRTAIVALLIQAGAKLDLKNKAGNDASHMASRDTIALLKQAAA